MQGLSLCEKYFNEVGLPVLEKECGGLIDRMAFGLVGDGSECYGFDDKISRDHDWGAGFCIWLWFSSPSRRIGGQEFLKLVLAEVLILSRIKVFVKCG